MELALSIRIDLPAGGRFGPGKAALLTGIEATGSIRAAAERLGMSYPKALKLIEQLNADFAEPLVQSQHGGHGRGGSELSLEGRRVLALYQSICAKATEAVRSDLEEAAALVARNPH